MAGILSPNSSLYRALNAATDLVIVNLLTLLGCIPVVTAGASLVACSRVSMEIARDEDSYIVRSWWKALRQNLRQSLGWWIPMLALLALGWTENWLIGGLMSPGLAGALTAVVLVGAVLLVALLSWLAPLVAFFDNTVSGHMGNAALLMIAHLGRTTLCVAVAAAPLALCALVPGARTPAIWFMVLIGVGFVSYLHSLIQLSVMDELRAAAATGSPATGRR